LQSRSATSPEVAAQLAVAANRVSMIARIHHRLHSYDGVQAVEFRKFLEDFALDFRALLSSDERAEQILVEGIELNLPAETAIPLGFIVSELITNAAKHGNGRSAIRLELDPTYGYALSVSNDGPALPEGFDPGDSKGLGMRIIQSFARQIGGELRVGPGDGGHALVRRRIRESDDRGDVEPRARDHRNRLIQLRVIEQRPFGEQGVNARRHIRRCRLGVGEAENARGRHALKQQSHDALRQHISLAGPRMRRDPGGNSRIGCARLRVLRRGRDRAAAHASPPPSRDHSLTRAR